MSKNCQCKFCKWRRKEITDLEYCQYEIDYLKFQLDRLINASKEELEEKLESGWTMGWETFILVDEIDCLFEIQKEDENRSEISLLFKSMGGDDLISKIKNLTRSK